MEMAGWHSGTRTARNMVDFYFRNQTAKELLAQIRRLELYDSCLPMERELAALSLEAGDWPVCEGGSVEWNLRIYDSPEAEYVDQSVEYPDIAGFPYFREWRWTCIMDKGTEGEELSGESWSFHSVQYAGITVISRLPFGIEDILDVSEGAEEWKVDRGNGGVQAYRPVSDLYEVTEESPDSNYATVMQVSADFIAGYEGPLYILSRNKETGQVKIASRVNSEQDILIDDTDIDRIIRGEKTDFYGEVVRIVEDMTKTYVNDILGTLRERGKAQYIVDAVMAYQNGGQAGVSASLGAGQLTDYDTIRKIVLQVMEERENGADGSNRAAADIMEMAEQPGSSGTDEILNLDDEALGGILQSLEAFKG